MPVANRVAMNLERVLPIFEVVRNRGAFGRQFFRLAHRHKARAEVVRQSRREDKTTRFNADDSVDLRSLEFGGQRIDSLAQAFGVFQQRRNIVKVNPRLGKVGHFANQSFQFVHGFRVVAPYRVLPR